MPDQAKCLNRSEGFIYEVSAIFPHSQPVSHCKTDNYPQGGQEYNAVVFIYDTCFPNSFTFAPFYQLQEWNC